MRSVLTGRAAENERLSAGILRMQWGCVIDVAKAQVAAISATSKWQANDLRPTESVQPVNNARQNMQRQLLPKRGSLCDVKRKGKRRQLREGKVADILARRGLSGRGQG